MGKSGGGCLVVLILGAVAAPDVGLILFAVTIIAMAGGSVGEHEAWLNTYIIIGMVASYVVPAVLAIGGFVAGLAMESLGFIAAIIPMVAAYLLAASVIFALPSSFIADSGCKAGKPQAEWAMRVIPLVWGMETFVAGPNERIKCVNGSLQ